jgi:ribosomal protein S27AE
MSILDSIKGLLGGETKKGTCSKCGKIIIMSKSSIVLEAKDYGYCPICKKLFCKKCASVAVLAEEDSPLECITCSVKLKGTL